VAVQTVTRDDLLQKAAAATNPADISSQAKVLELVTKAMPDDPVTPETKADAEPEAKPEGKAAEQPKPKNPNPAMQKRIDELTREKREIDEFAQSEYEGRVQAQRRVVELEAELAKQSPKPEEKPKAEELKEPKRPVAAEFTDSEKYTEAMSQYAEERADYAVKKDRRERDEAEAKRKKDEDEARAKAAAEEQNKILLERTEIARAAISDFDEVLMTAHNDKTRPLVPLHVVAYINDSELGPQMAYALAKDRALADRIFKLPATRALAELGQMELAYAKPEKKGSAPAPKSPTTTGAPAPLPSLNGAPGDVARPDMSNLPFSEYKRRKLEEQRRSRR
jgi:hypothetical protein